MQPERRSTDQRSALEQHVGTILQVLVVALLGWSLSTTVDLRTDIGIMKAEMKAMQATLSQGTADRYRGSDAARDQKAIWDEMTRIDARVTKLEVKVRP